MSVLLTNENNNNSLTASLESIKHFIETELHFKQVQIVRLQHTIDTLKKELEETQLLFETRNSQFQNAIQQNEGNKQIINKLLGDISTLQNNVEWYKRTYEKRSILGYFKELFTRKRH